MARSQKGKQSAIRLKTLKDKQVYFSLHKDAVRVSRMLIHLTAYDIINFQPSLRVSLNINTDQCKAIGRNITATMQSYYDSWKNG